MAINLGTGAISKLYLGATEIQKAYLGGSLVYDVGGAAWTPANLASLFAWYDASDLATITESGGAVSQWDDKKAAYDVTQATASEQPKTNVRTLNALNVLDFDGGDKLDNIGGFALGNNDYSVFTVSQSDINIAAVELLFASSTATGDRVLQIYKNTNVFQIFVWHGGTVTTLSHSDGGNPNDAFIKSVVVDFGATAKSYLNGDDLKSVSIGASPRSVSHIAIGAWYVNSGTRWDGGIAEQIICSAAVSDADREKVEGYLAHKWGLTGNLPAGHPYKTVAP